MVATKRIGNAVCRNRIRRLLREAMWRLCASIRPGSDLVVVARSRMVDASFEQVYSALADALSRAGLFRGPPAGNTSVDGLQF
jgi:ribonuclease P protein component